MASDVNTLHNFFSDESFYFVKKKVKKKIH